MNKNEPTEASQIIVVDDEIAIAQLVADIFTAEGMRVDVFSDPFDALEAFKSICYDLAIVDVMMPGMDGFELCRCMHSISSLPVVFLSAKDAEVDIVTGLTLGADDYVTKPFKPRELVARVKARLRRRTFGEQRNNGEGSMLAAQGIEVDTVSHTATLHDIPLQLTPKEFAILVQLLLRKGQPVPSRELYEAAWGEPANASSANTIMVHIRHLRCKLAEVDSSHDFIETAWGVGYRIALSKVDNGNR